MRGRLQVVPCGTTVGPLMQDSRVWVRSLTRTRQRVIPRWCMGARPISRTCRHDRPRWYHSWPFVGIWCRLYLAGLLHVTPCGTTAGPLVHDNRVWVRGLTRTRQRIIPRRCMGARPNPHVPTGYTSLVSLYKEVVCGDGVQVIPCGVGCRLYLAVSPVGPLTKATHNGGWDIIGMVMLPRMHSIATAA